MSIEKGRITGVEFTFAVFCFMQAAFMRLSFATATTKNDPG